MAPCAAPQSTTCCAQQLIGERVGGKTIPKKWGQRLTPRQNRPKNPERSWAERQGGKAWQHRTRAAAREQTESDAPAQKLTYALASTASSLAEAQPREQMRNNRAHSSASGAEAAATTALQEEERFQEPGHVVCASGLCIRGVHMRRKAHAQRAGAAGGRRRPKRPPGDQ
jgi:hypothetical protein